MNIKKVTVKLLIFSIHTCLTKIKGFSSGNIFFLNKGQEQSNNVLM